MKEVIYKNILSGNPRKHEVSLEEMQNKRASLVRKKCISKYFIKNKFTSSDIEEIKKWIEQDKKSVNRKHYHFFTYMDTKTGYQRVMCKMFGTFYVVAGLTAFKIMYLNEVLVEIENDEVKERTDV